MTTPRPTSDQIAAMREMRAARATVLEIQRVYPFHETTIKRYVKDVPFTHRNGQKLPPDVEVVRLVESGMTRREIALRYDVTDSAVCNVLKKARAA